ncbi:MAG: MSHA biogenesis protein MshK [Vibrionaceae bacterium]
MRAKGSFAAAVIFFSGVSLLQAKTHDPTAPLDWSSPRAPMRRASSVAATPKLDAIFCGSSAGNCIAILGGKKAARGEVINGYAIDLITPEQVVVSRGRKTWRLSIFEQQVIQ